MTICGWCDDLMIPTAAPTRSAEAVSHGLCPSCLDAALARAAARRAAPAPRLPVARPPVPAPAFARA